MPLLGKKSYKPNPLPKDLKSEEEVFVIKETNEVFRKYEYPWFLQIVHHSSCELQTLVQQCYKKLEKEYVENEPVECRISGKWTFEARYDIKCDGVQDRLKDVSPGDIKRHKKLPSEEMLKCFIRANTENPWRNDNSPWMVKTKQPLHPKFPQRKQSSEKQKKRTVEESPGRWETTIVTRQILIVREN
ncbi:Histidine-containing phosphotransfer protein 3 [Desmophyllum pertusum]|uniref:Histidine-containing phosphotransfer protein 3 n=1 Tax=Desmophyllum pertusum TaxID=174260 RepID=A0A9W9ZVC3_9CNID|nr:Histidine-containing phosphotransfer protein 3 [Desmophyllum pertusum]